MFQKISLLLCKILRYLLYSSEVKPSQLGLQNTLTASLQTGKISSQQVCWI